MAHKKTRANAGETLVEVIASIFIFLIMMGILQGAISYSHASLQKNKEIRADNETIIKELVGTSSTVDSTKNISFVAARSDLQVFGNQVFTVKTELRKKTVSYENTDQQMKTTTFYLYGPALEPQVSDENPPAAGGDGS